MRRRRVLAAGAGLAGVTAGCLSGPNARGTDAFTVSNPPASLHEAGGCPRESVLASLSLADPTDSPPPTGAVVRYRDLQDSARLVVRFCLARGSAVTCNDAKPFSALLGDLLDLDDRYRDEHGEPPSALVVRTAGAFHRLAELRVYDQVLVR